MPVTNAITEMRVGSAQVQSLYRGSTLLWSAGAGSDPNFNNVSLLIHATGDNGSTTFTDSSNNRLTLTGNNGLAISSEQTLFGNNSIRFNGTTQYLTVAADSTLSFGTGDYTVEFWIYSSTRHSGTPYSRVIETNQIFTTPGDFKIWLTGSDANGQFGGSNNAIEHAEQDNDGVIVSSPFPLNQWNHVAVTRNSGTGRIFLNGVLQDTQADGADYNQAGLPGRGFVIGYRPYFENNTYFNGFLSEIRITTGLARYTADFNVPTTVFPEE